MRLTVVVSTLVTVALLQTALSANISQKLSRAHFQFSVDLFKSLLKDEDMSGNNNLVFSPYSVNSLLSMLFLGTSSSSKSSEQLREVLHYENISYVDVHNAFKEVVNTFDDNYYAKKVKSVNGLFVQNGVTVSSPYDRALREFYHAKVEHIDFRNADPSQTMGVVNDWIKDVTEGQIPTLLDVPPSKGSKLLLVNAMALDAKWLNPFNPQETFEKGLYFLPGNKRLEIPMMSGRHTLPLGYSPEMECRILEIPFTQRRISMFILLPDEPQGGIQRLEKNLTAANLKMLLSTLQDEVVNVRLPKFKLSGEVNLQDALEGLGLEDIFHPANSDLSLMAPKDKLHLSSIAHKSVLEVTESGAKGSAATFASLERVGTFGQKYFEVDHPFIFLVWDYYSGMLLLMGRVIHPESIGDGAE
eukprot:maker-scaffold989_size72935-snap-gene-0.9 protein:Tk08549 transcript:maker-scaffold989_size72935-snap-gene-0.9-mRNA-1 annotation:"hypothetical protein DAPPUDRAFT_51792"